MDVHLHFLASGRIGPIDPNKTQEFVDFCVVENIPSNYTKIENRSDDNSDHSSVSLKICDKIILKNQNPTLSNKHIDWDYFIYWKILSSYS